MNTEQFQAAVEKLAGGRTHVARIERWYFKPTNSWSLTYAGSVFSDVDGDKIYAGQAETPEEALSRLVQALARGNEV